MIYYDINIMEHIFIESVVLASFINQPLTVEYLSTNYRDIIPDAYALDNLKTDFIKLYNNELSNILEPEMLITILHKYGIKKYYEQMLEHLIWKIMRLEFKPISLCSDILHDIINFNIDFKNILNFLINQDTNELQNTDFIFSIELIKFYFNLQSQINIHIPNKKLCPHMAIKYGLFDVLKYLVDIDECENTCICFFAAGYGNFDILKWAHENNFEWNEKTCAIATINEHFDILKWLHENNCPWDEMVCINAIKRNNFDILKWARENGCRLFLSSLNEAIILGNNDILEWITSDSYKNLLVYPYNGISLQTLARFGGFGNITYSN